MHKKRAHGQVPSDKCAYLGLVPRSRGGWRSVCSVPSRKSRSGHSGARLLITFRTSISLPSILNLGQYSEQLLPSFYRGLNRHQSSRPAASAATSTSTSTTTGFQGPAPKIYETARERKQRLQQKNQRLLQPDQPYSEMPSNNKYKSGIHASETELSNLGTHRGSEGSVDSRSQKTRSINLAMEDGVTSRREMGGLQRHLTYANPGSSAAMYNSQDLRTVWTFEMYQKLQHKPYHSFLSFRFYN